MQYGLIYILITKVLVYGSRSLIAGCLARIFAKTQPTSPNRDMDMDPAMKDIMGTRNFLSKKQISLSSVQETKRKDIWRDQDFVSVLSADLLLSMFVVAGCYCI